MTPIIPVNLQSLEYHLGSYLSIRYCAPLAFFMLLRAHGYISREVMPGPFCQGLNRDELTTSTADWSRPALSQLLRKKYKVPIVSWQLNRGQHSMDSMKRAGYLKTAREIRFFNEYVMGYDVEDLVRAGYPVIVTMKPGFSHQENSNIHAVIIAKWEDDEVKVYDPDARNPQTTFSPDHVRQYISREGAGSIVLANRT